MMVLSNEPLDHHVYRMNSKCYGHHGNVHHGKRGGKPQCIIVAFVLPRSLYSCCTRFRIMISLWKRYTDIVRTNSRNEPPSPSDRFVHSCMHSSDRLCQVIDMTIDCRKPPSYLIEFSGNQLLGQLADIAIVNLDVDQGYSIIRQSLFHHAFHFC